MRHSIRVKAVAPNTRKAGFGFMDMDVSSIEFASGSASMKSDYLMATSRGPKQVQEYFAQKTEDPRGLWPNFKSPPRLPRTALLADSTHIGEAKDDSVCLEVKNSEECYLCKVGVPTIATMQFYNRNNVSLTY